MRRVSTLKIAHRPDLCVVPNHRGIAEQLVGAVLCRVHVAHRDRVLSAWWARYAEKLDANPDVRLLPGASEPPIPFRLVAG